VVPVSGSAPGAAAQLTNEVASGGNFEFSFSGTVGAKYVLEESSNLVTWIALATNTVSASGSVSVTNAMAGRHELFFRAVSPGN